MPAMFDQTKADRICELLAEGKSLRASAKEVGISAMTPYGWRESNADFDLRYARARQMGYEARADEFLDTAKDESIEPASRRIIVDAMKWELSKVLPKLYGDKLDMAVSGDLTVNIRKMTLPDTTDSVPVPKKAGLDGG